MDLEGLYSSILADMLWLKYDFFLHFEEERQPGDSGSATNGFVGQYPRGYVKLRLLFFHWYFEQEHQPVDLSSATTARTAPYDECGNEGCPVSTSPIDVWWCSMKVVYLPQAAICYFWTLATFLPTPDLYDEQAWLWENGCEKMVKSRVLRRWTDSLQSFPLPHYHAALSTMAPKISVYCPHCGK